MLTAVYSQRIRQFETIFKAHAQLMYRTAYGVLGTHHDAEDVVQTIFLKLIRQEFPPDLEKNPEAYLYRAAVNASLSTIRNRRHEVLVENWQPFETPAPGDSPVVSDVNERHRRLYEAIAELKPEAAQIVILRYMHDKSDAEIARLFGVSRGAIALKLFRSRMKLRKLLRETLGGER
jgi:RNA polymerase sigma-70 factor (ECF subfamily)